MAGTIVTLKGQFAQEKAQGWEERIYQEGCAVMREQAREYLEALDDELLRHKPAGWRVVGKGKRKVMTRFGVVEVQRRVYHDRRGRPRFLLDEYLGWPPSVLVTPSLREGLLEVVAELGYDKTAHLVEVLTAGVVSKTTVWREVQRVGERICEAEAEEAEAVYKRGKIDYPFGGRQVERLYVEADGIWLRLQREQEKHMELKVGIAYEGWERIPHQREGYRLVGKRVYVHGHDRCHFWEGASLAWFRHWDPGSIKEVIVGGDGAEWIRQGQHILAQAVWQVDGFHLKRACVRALGKEQGARLYEAIRNGRWEEGMQLWQQSPCPQGKQARDAYRWLGHLLQAREGQDWRQRVRQAPKEARGLGTMEGNIAHIIADRMEGKGRSWSRRGALHLAKVREYLFNDTLHPWCYRPPASSPSPKPVRRPRKPDTAAWLQAHIPALEGRFPNDPALLRLKQWLSR